ncbi:glycosyltransferase family 2 protein [Tenacibaculum salmonis]|uniref:glycosyltransferase family 2 protein n=1 Tax=Tenacibaculum sp. P3-BQ1 TaxID=3232310 RepID=UPI0034DEC538
MISIILPVYNVEKFVERSIKSILNQVFKEFELIIINDGSTDISLEICQQFLKDERVRIISQENGGLSKARNEGLKLVKYPYVTFIDSDDWVEPEFLETLYNCIISSDAEIAICEYRIIDETNNGKNKVINRCNNNDINVFSKNEALSLLFIDNYINNYAWCKLYKTSLFKEVKYPEGKYYEDIATTFKIFDKATKIVKQDKVLLNYIQHNNNITSKENRSDKKYLDVYDAFFQQLNYVNKHHDKFKDNFEIKSLFIKNLYRLKKRFILGFTNKTKEVIEKENKLDKELISLLRAMPVLKLNKFFYLKTYLTIKYPVFFKKYLTLTKR